MTYAYRAILQSPDDAHDGDTLRMDVDLGFGVWLHRQTFRLYGIDTPEVRGGTNATRAAAHAARMRLLELIYEHGEAHTSEATILTIRTHRDKADKFGRMLAEILTPAGETINQILVREGHARPFMA